MTGLFAGHAYSHVLRRGQPLAFTHDLARRMSPLQKAVLNAAASFAAAERPRFDLVFRELEAPVYLASAMGELDSVLRIFHAIVEGELPVSPTAFQHSVHNAALGYFSIIHRSHAAHLALSSGYLSAEKALLLASRRIRSGIDRAICLVNATETLGETSGGGDELARCELFLLFGRDLATELRPAYELASCEYHGDAGPVDVPEGAALVEHREPDGASWQPEFSLHEQRPLAYRVVTSLDGESVRSLWRPL
jgi:hypothetical protein